MLKLHLSLVAPERELFSGEVDQVVAPGADFLVIGESAKHLSPAVRKRIADVPWHDVIAIRNRIAHGCHTVSFDRLWGIINEDIDAMQAAVERLSMPPE